MKSRFTDQQIVTLLAEANLWQGTVEEFCREKNISAQTYYQWKRKFNGMEANDVKKMKDLEKENARLKKLLAEKSLDVEILQEAIQKKS